MVSIYLYCLILNTGATGLSLGKTTPFVEKNYDIEAEMDDFIELLQTRAHVHDHLGESAHIVVPVNMQEVPAYPRPASAFRIPNKIFFTAHWYPDDEVQWNRQFVPGNTEFLYFDDKAMENSVKEISKKLETLGVFGVYAAFQQLRPMSFRADLWRLMILWENGGIYLDAKLRLTDNITSFIGVKTENVAVCSQSNDMYWTGALAAPPRAPLLLATIRHIVANVRKHYYGPSKHPEPALCATGPCALTQAIKKGGFQPQTDCMFEVVDDTDGIDQRLVKISDKNTTLMVSNISTHQKIRHHSDYRYLFQAHAIYCDEEPPLANFPHYFDPCQYD